MYRFVSYIFFMHDVNCVISALDCTRGGTGHVILPVVTGTFSDAIGMCYLPVQSLQMVSFIKPSNEATIKANISVTLMIRASIASRRCM